MWDLLTEEAQFVTRANENHKFITSDDMHTIVMNRKVKSVSYPLDGSTACVSLKIT